MKKSNTVNILHPIPAAEQSIIYGGGGWLDKAIWYIIYNWDEIKQGLRDGYNDYQKIR